MIVKTILYHPKFVRDLRELSTTIQERALKAETFFRTNPLHPSLRLHPLKGALEGSWSISITTKVRIIFKRSSSGAIVFYSIGHHDIYQSL